MVQSLKAVCATGGFKLTKWTSNSHSVLASLSQEERGKEIKHIDLEKDKPTVEHALSMRWEIESDMFFFNITLKEQPHTRRGILSVLHSIYNRLGFLSPVVLTGKKVLQELCKMHHGWDEEAALASRVAEGA